MNLKRSPFAIQDKNARILIKFTALCGQASIEEARGNEKGAHKIYKDAAEITKDEYPSLSLQAEFRSNTALDYSSSIKLVETMNYKEKDTESTTINVNQELQEIINKKIEPSPDG